MDIALWIQLLVWLVVLGFFLASGKASVFHPAMLYLVFHGVVFVLRPFLVHCFGFDSVWKYMQLKPDEADLYRTLAVSSLGLVSFVVFSCAVSRTPVGFDSSKIRCFTETERLALILTTLLLLPLVVYSIQMTAKQGGGAGELVKLVPGAIIHTETTGYLMDAQNVTGSLICAWLVVTRFHRFNLVPLGLFIAYRSWCGWNRFSIVLLFLMIVFAYCWQHRKKWVPAWSLAVAVPLFVLFNLLGHNREFFHAQKADTIDYEEKGVAMSQTEKIRQQLDTQDFANFDYLAAVVTVIPARSGTYTYGLQYLQLFTEPIPRILWKEKPVGAPFGSFNIGQYANFIGLTFSLPGDGWTSGGWLGVFIELGLAGLILRAAHLYFWKHVNNPKVAIFYISGLAMVPQWYRDGGISIAKFLLWAWLPLILWMAMSWLLDRRMVPASSIILSRGSAVQLIQHGAAQGTRVTHIIVER